jgi:hypothetical protein
MISPALKHARRKGKLEIGVAGLLARVLSKLMILLGTS